MTHHFLGVRPMFAENADLHALLPGRKRMFPPQLSQQVLPGRSKQKAPLLRDFGDQG